MKARWWHKPIFINVVASILSIALPLIGGLSMSKTRVVQSSSLLSALATECQAGDNSKAFLKTRIDSNDEGKSRALDFFTQYWVWNFSGHVTHLVCGTNGGDLSRQKMVFCDSVVSESGAISTTEFFSNSNKRFETICFELLKDRPKEDEMSNPTGWSAAGKVWLPDYFGDRIISNSKGRFTSYDDILFSNIPFRIQTSSGEYKEYKIANFFHVAGFTPAFSLPDEAYKSSDYGFGTMMSKFLKDFIITSDLSLAGSESSCVVSMVDAKRFNLSEYLQLISGYSKSSVISINFFKTSGGEVVHLKEYESLLEVSTAFDANDILPILLFLLVLLLELSPLILFLFFKKKRTTIPGAAFIIGGASAVVFGGTIQLFRAVLFQNKAWFGFTFNRFFGIALLVSVLVNFVCLGVKTFNERA